MSTKIVRNIVEIDEDKCDGCGLCVPSCAEGAIQLIDGKAKLVSEIYCDGLGACLGHCPQDAITITEREADDFDEKAVEDHLAKIGNDEHAVTAEETLQPPVHQCPGTMMRDMSANKPAANATNMASQLTNWPIQLMLAPPVAPYFENANLLIAADCVPFAYPDFHFLLQGKILLIGCPKLDDSEFYAQKLGQILKSNEIKSVTVAHMEVPCCFGLKAFVEKAVESSGKNIIVDTQVFGVDGGRVK